MRPLPFHSSEHMRGFQSHHLQFCILSRRTSSIVRNSTQLHPISTPYRVHEERFMDFSMAANADVAATAGTEYETLHVATIARHIKTLELCVGPANGPWMQRFHWNFFSPGLKRKST